MENFLYEDDLIIRCEIIISIFRNIQKISDQEFLNLFDTILKKYLEMNFSTENLFFRDKVFFSLVEEIPKKMIIEKNYTIIIKNFIKKFIMINEIFTQTKDNYLFVKSTKIYCKIFLYLEDIDSVFKNQNDQNFMIDFILFLIRIIFEINIPNQIQNSNGNLSTTPSNQRNSNRNLITITNNKENTNSQISCMFIIIK